VLALDFRSLLLVAEVGAGALAGRLAGCRCLEGGKYSLQRLPGEEMWRRRVWRAWHHPFLQPAATITPGHVPGHAPALPHASGAQPLPLSPYCQHSPSDPGGDEPGWCVAWGAPLDRLVSSEIDPASHSERVRGGVPWS
jgi:hypothetical protein